jgi:hypothetical protein
MGGGGERFRSFLGLREKTFLLNIMPQGAVLPPAGRVFFKILHHHSILVKMGC